MTRHQATWALFMAALSAWIIVFGKGCVERVADKHIDTPDQVGQHRPEEMQ